MELRQGTKAEKRRGIYHVEGAQNKREGNGRIGMRRGQLMEDNDELGLFRLEFPFRQGEHRDPEKNGLKSLLRCVYSGIKELLNVAAMKCLSSVRSRRSC